MRIEIYIPVSVIVDTELGTCELNEVGSESWPTRVGPDAWNIDKMDWENQLPHYREEADKAYAYLSAVLEKGKEIADAMPQP